MKALGSVKGITEIITTGEVYTPEERSDMSKKRKKKDRRRQLILTQSTLG